MITQVALYIGYIVIVSGSIAATALLVCLPIDYAWRRFGDVGTLIRVIREAKRQGRPILKNREPSYDSK